MTNLTLVCGVHIPSPCHSVQHYIHHFLSYFSEFWLHSYTRTVWSESESGNKTQPEIKFTKMMSCNKNTKASEASEGSCAIYTTESEKEDQKRGGRKLWLKGRDRCGWCTQSLKREWWEMTSTLLQKTRGIEVKCKYHLSKLNQSNSQKPEVTKINGGLS